MQQVPKGVVVGVGVSLLLVVAAVFAARAPKVETQLEQADWADSCFRYGRFECCVKSE